MPFKRKKFKYKPRTAAQLEVRIHQGEGPPPPIKEPKKIVYGDPVEVGRKGGQVRSAAKARAARRNAKKGGRPATRTLAERLMNQKLTPDQIEAITKLLGRNRPLLIVETDRLSEFFGVKVDKQLDSTAWTRKTARMPKDIRYIVDKFRRGVKFHLGKVKPPKDFVVAYRTRSPEQQREWQQDRRHDGIPCPPERRKIFFRNFRGFRDVADQFERNPDMTVQDVSDLGGGECGSCAKEILEYLRGMAALKLAKPVK